MNLVKTAILLAAMTMLFMGIGYMIAGQAGMLLALVLAAAMNLFSWWNSGKMILKMHNAREVDENTSPILLKMVQELANNADLPMPKVYILETEQPNAFATGRNPANAAVAVSTGMLDKLEEDEVAAVLAHELAHIQSRDTLTMTITATLAGAIGMIANYAMFFGRRGPFGFIGSLATMLLAPMAAGVVQMAISRTREYEADRDGAEISGTPLSLASALNKIEALARSTMNEPAEHAPGTAHLFIINPLNGRSMDSLFSTHPSTQNRIAELEKLAENWGKGKEPTTSNRAAASHSKTKPKIQKEVWGRNAGEWRDEVHNGPWSSTKKSAKEPSQSNKKGPWK